MKPGNRVKTNVARYRLDDLIIDTGTRRILRGDVDLDVTGLSFDLLLALGEAAPNLLSADEINERVWPGQVVSAETIAQRIKMVRQLLGDNAARPRYIAGLRGRGYRVLSPMMRLQKARTASGGASAQAYELYVQARAIVRGTRASKDEALRFLAEAIRLDPDFAPALAYRALLQAGSVPLTGAPRELLDSAERDAEQALSLDSGLADAHVARGMVYADRLQWIEARAHFDAAREIEAEDAFVDDLYALFLLRPTGRLKEACAQLTETYRVQPTDGFTLHELILTHSLLGNDGEALKYARLSATLSGISHPPWDVVLAFARAEARRGAFGEATSQAINALPPVLRAHGGADVVGTFYGALGSRSQIPRACQMLESFAPRLEAVEVDGRTRAFFITAFAMLGALDAAYGLLDRFLFSSAEPWSVDLSDLWSPEMREFRADARFRPLVERLGLTDYWQTFALSPDADVS